MNTNNRKTVLGYPNTVPVLIYIYEAGGSTISSYITEVVRNYNSVKSAAMKLSDEGLIRIVKHDGRSSFITYELTELGFEVAKDLKNANDKLMSSFENNH